MYHPHPSIPVGHGSSNPRPLGPMVLWWTSRASTWNVVWRRWRAKGRLCRMHRFNTVQSSDFIGDDDPNYCMIFVGWLLFMVVYWWYIMIASYWTWKIESTKCKLQEVDAFEMKFGLVCKLTAAPRFMLFSPNSCINVVTFLPKLE